MQNTLLIVDDEPRVIAAFRRVFIDEPCEIFSANTGIEGLKHLKREKIKVVISDEKMPGMSGIELLQKVKQIDKDVPFVIITAFGAVDMAVDQVGRILVQHRNRRIQRPVTQIVAYRPRQVPLVVIGRNIDND